MMKKNSLQSAFVLGIIAACAVVCIGCATAEANRQTQPPDDAFTVNQNNDNTITITGYNGTAKNIIIPDTLFGLKVTAIAGSAFDRKGLSGVVIPNTVTTIGHSAFARNSFHQGVTIGNAVRTIGEQAFFNNSSLAEIVIPDSVTAIGESAFSSCSSLRAVTIGNHLATIGRRVFFNNSSLAEIVIPDSVTAIGEEAFSDCSSLRAVTIGSRVRTIGEKAFYNNSSLTEIVIPDSVTAIGEEAFSGEGEAKSIGGRYVRTAYEGNLTTVQLGQGLKTIGGNAFAFNKISALVIPDGVTRIENGAFGNNPLTELVIPPSLGVTGDIDSSAFADCPLTRVTLPENMNDRNMAAFEGNLRSFYNGQNKAAGTYVKNGPVWTRQ